jgi:hypothetical protein
MILSHYSLTCFKVGEQTGMEQEDVDTIIRVEAIQQRSMPNLRIICCLFLKHNKFMLEGIIPDSDIICVDHLKGR